MQADSISSSSSWIEMARRWGAQHGLLLGVCLVVIALAITFVSLLGHAPGPTGTPPPPVARQSEERPATDASTVAMEKPTTVDQPPQSHSPTASPMARPPSATARPRDDTSSRLRLKAAAPLGTGTSGAHAFPSASSATASTALNPSKRPAQTFPAQPDITSDPQPTGRWPSSGVTAITQFDLPSRATDTIASASILTGVSNPMPAAPLGTPSGVAAPAAAMADGPRPAMTATVQPEAVEPTASRLQQPVVWNYWLDTLGQPDHVPSTLRAPLTVGTTNHLRFRLSLLDLVQLFPGMGSLQTAQELAQAIEQGVKRDAEKLDLEILISPIDEKRTRVATTARRVPLTIDLKVMQEALASPDTIVRPGDFPLSEVLRRTTIAQFGVDFQALAEGSHQIGIAMMDSATGLPLQTMMVEAKTGVPWPASLNVKANGQNLLAERSLPFDMSLLLIGQGRQADTTDDNELHAWLGYRDKATGAYDFVAWKTDVSLRGLIDATGSFIVTEGAAETGAALKDAGLQLANLIFDPVASNNRALGDAALANIENAEKARGIIARAADYPAGSLPPSMLVSIIGGADIEYGRFASTVIPIGALGVSTGKNGNPVFLGERFSLALMLNGQPPGAGTACTSNWYMAVPNDDVQTSGPLFDALNDLAPMMNRWPGDMWARQSASLKELREWMGTASPTANQDAVVFSYLGHHDMGRLFLRDKSENNMLVGAMRRSFGSSSIAILNACSSAMKEISDGTWIGRLAKRNVAATIATTSPVSGHLAAAYMDCLSSVLAKHPEIQIGEAHALATQCLWSPEGGKPWGRNYTFSGAALKYILVGNPFQRICAPTLQPAKL